MRRREFVVSVCVATIVRPISTRAQQKAMPVVGVLVAGKPDPAVPLRLFRDGLRDLGYVEGQNVRIEVRNAEGDAERLAELAAGLVRDNVDVIATWQTPPSAAAKRATSEIPIVMLSAADPVSTGLVSSLARPGGNVTGMAAPQSELAAKNLELLKESIVAIRRVVALGLTDNPASAEFLKQVELAGERLGVAVHPETSRPGEELENTFRAMATDRVDGVVILPSLPTAASAELALRYRLPAASPWRPFAEAGGLIAYTLEPRAYFRESAAMVDKIIRGAKPADLPVEQPTRFELVINLKTAKALGLTVPQSILARADEIIE